ncbi:MAG: hypothetical protein V1799_02505 [bacterium]
MKTLISMFRLLRYVILSTNFIVVIVLPTLSQQQTDTLRVSGKAVVLFAPAQAERDSLPEKDRDDMEEVMADYGEYASRILRFLDSLKISSYETTATRFLVIQQGGSPVFFDRKSLGSDLGFIFFLQGKKPTVFTGVHTDLELRPTIIEYFGVSNHNAIDQLKR